MVRRLPWLFACALLFGSLPRLATAQCATGPGAVAADAVQTASSANVALTDHAGLVATDDFTRDLLDSPEEHRVQLSLRFANRGIAGYDVCDSADWQDARLRRQRLGATAGIPLWSFGRLEGRVSGVSDSVLQADADAYRPPEGAEDVALPGAGGAGFGIWSVRFTLLDWATLMVGRIGTHDIRHSVGWDEDHDDDGDFIGYSPSNTTHWGSADAVRTFIGIGSPRLGATDLMIGAGGLERITLRSPFLPMDDNVDAQAMGGWDGIDEVAIAGVSSQTRLPSKLPLWWTVAVQAQSASRPLRSAVGGLTAAGVEQHRGRHFEWVRVAAHAGVAGSKHLDGYAPGVWTTADLTLPIFGLARLGGWAGVNRTSTVLTVPQTVGRPEVGVQLYVSATL